MRYPDMSDDDLMEKMALHVQPLLEWASWNKHDFMKYLKRDIATEYGVAKALELIGEIANNVSPAGKSRFLSIDFESWASWRHAITHGYEGLDHEEMWQTIWRDIPDLGCSLSEYGFLRK